MRLAVYQIETVPGDVEANLGLIAGAAERASEAGANVLLVPELALTSYGAGDRFAELAEPVDGVSAKVLAAMSLHLKLDIVVGMAERADGKIWNSALLFQRGEVTGVYRKRQLYGAYETGYFAPGPCDSTLFDIGGMKTGLAICYDIEFPETARALALAGAKLILVPTAVPVSKSAEFIARYVLPVRAFENEVFVAYANHAGTDDRYSYTGRSCICAPDGSDLARADGEGEALLIADLEPARYIAFNAEVPYLKDLRAAGRVPA